MKSYTLKSIGNSSDYMTIVREMEDGYDEVKTDYIGKELFESCIRTGYLVEIAEPVKIAVNA